MLHCDNTRPLTAQKKQLKISKIIFFTFQLVTKSLYPSECHGNVVKEEMGQERLVVTRKGKLTYTTYTVNSMDFIILIVCDLVPCRFVNICVDL